MGKSVCRPVSGDMWLSSVDLIQHSFIDGSYQADGSLKEEEFSGSLLKQTDDRNGE